MHRLCTHFAPKHLNKLYRCAPLTEGNKMSKEAKKTILWLGLIYGVAIVATVLINL